MLAATDVKPITYLKNSAAELVREVSEEKRTVLITQHGEAKVVVMDVTLYDKWRKAAMLFKALSLSVADSRAGRTVSTEDALARFDRSLNAPEENGRSG